MKKKIFIILGVAAVLLFIAASLEVFHTIATSEWLPMRIRLNKTKEE